MDKVSCAKLSDPYNEISGLLEELEGAADTLNERIYSKASRLVGEFPQEADPPARPQSVDDGFLGHTIRQQNLLLNKLKRCLSILDRF